MPYRYRIFRDKHYIFVEADGRVTGDEIYSASVRLMNDPEWVDISGQLCDFRKIAGLSVTLDDIKAILDLEKKHFEKLKGGRQAFVVRNDLHEQLCKLYIAMSKLRKHPQETRVFRSMEVALAWVVEKVP